MSSRDASDEADHADVVAMPPALYLISILAGLMAKWWWGGSIAPGNHLRLAVGALILAVGAVGSFWFARAFRQAGQARSPRTPTSALVTHGLYRYSRNPAYVSLTLVQIGFGVLLDNVWILVALVPVLVIMHRGVILREEAYLERKFGDEYLRYKTRVRRWL